MMSLEMESCGQGHAAEVPRVPKSARGKRSVRKKEAQSQVMSAFDLLATVAGKLLDEGDGSVGAPALTACPKDVRVKQEQRDEEMEHLKHELTDQDSCNESAILPHIVFQQSVSNARNEDPKAKSEDQDKESSMISSTKAELGSNFRAITELWSPESVEAGDAVASLMPTAAAGFHKNAPDMYNLLDPMDVDMKPPPLVSSDSTGEMPRGLKGVAGYSVDRDDDDDKSSGCTHPSTTTNKDFRPNCTAEHSRVRKLLTCNKYRKVAPARMHKSDLSYSDVERKPSFRNKKMHYTRQRTQRSTFKRRKLFDRHAVLASEFGRANAKGNTKVTGRDSHVAFLEANKGTKSMPFQKSCASNDCHVKLRIKSFKVPELLVEIPESATIGSLKKTVLEAVNAILGGGLCVGVLHHGKKVRDDSKILKQAGIGQDDMLDNLGFSLEPNCTHNLSQVQPPEHISFMETIDITEPFTRIVPADSSCKHGEVDVSHELSLTPLAMNYQGSDHDSVHSPRGVSSPDKISTNSRALVPVPAADPDAGAIVPVNKSKRSPEQGQRRIRRPFSVAEVEALVLAVEKLGTGR
ncbi:unnamed protein product, partial [Urochloa humidicola]